MKIYITTAYPYHPRINCVTTYLKESADNDPFKIHELVDDPKDADAVIFTEHHPPSDPYFFDILKSEIYKKYKDKCYLYHDNDHSLTLIPTISPSVRSSYFDPTFHHQFSYIVQIETNKDIKAIGKIGNEKRYLFSFIGASRTNPIRKEILAINYKECYLQDTSAQNSWELSEAEKAVYYASYAKVCSESKFILCPAGIGPNSYRLYESLEMGIPPVIISDQWIPSAGPKWDDFSIRIAEADIDKIVEILKSKESDAEKMGVLAREAWERWFAKDKQFHLLTEACLTLHLSRKEVNTFTYLKQYKRFLEPYHFKNILRFYKRKLLSKN